MKPQAKAAQKPQDHSFGFIVFVLSCLFLSSMSRYFENLSLIYKLLIAAFITNTLIVLSCFYLKHFSSSAKKEKEIRRKISKIPEDIFSSKNNYLGFDLNLKKEIYLSDSIRSRHVHILGATGSGKTESVVLNLINQDAQKQHPIIIVDAKGDDSFLNYLNQDSKTAERLLVFDMSSDSPTCSYDPLLAGTATQAAQRLFNSLCWSEEYYKLRSRELLFTLFENFERNRGKRITLLDLRRILKSVDLINKECGFIEEFTRKDHADIAGLQAQIEQLCSGNLKKLLNHKQDGLNINISECIQDKRIVYFRLQSLLDQTTVSTIGRLIINDLSYYAGQSHRTKNNTLFCPVYLDEFGSLACEAFIELISKARSAGLALHFSHQSMGDLSALGSSYLSRITDNTSTKIVMRIYCPESAELMARSFGTSDSTKLTHRVDVEGENIEQQGQGSMRDVQTFRASPNDMKYLATGQGFAYIAHGNAYYKDAATVHRLQFPKLNQQMTIGGT